MNKKILLVEDEAAIGKVFKDQLVLGGGFEVDIASGGNEALQMLKSTKYDLMLLDLVMPEVDGLAVLQTMKEKPEEYKKIPVIALTNVTSEEVKKELEPYKLEGYILKLDVVPKELLEAVNNALAKTQA